MAQSRSPPLARRPCPDVRRRVERGAHRTPDVSGEVRCPRPTAQTRHEIDSGPFQAQVSPIIGGLRTRSWPFGTTCATKSRTCCTPPRSPPPYIVLFGIPPRNTHFTHLRESHR